MHRRHPIWYGIGFSVVPFFVLLLGYFNIHPEIYRSIPKSFGSRADASFSSIGWSEDEMADPPLEYISDSFKGVQIVTEPLKISSFWDLWSRPSTQIEYEWRYKVKNLTTTKLRISVTYELNGGDDFTIADSDASKVAEPGEIIEFKQLDSIGYTEALLVSASGWRISSTVNP